MKTLNTKKQKDSYVMLVQEFPLLVIRDDAQLKRSVKFMEELMTRDLDKGGEAYLDTLTNLIGDYEDQNLYIGPASDADMLRHLMEAKNVRQCDVAKGTGIPKSTISEIVNGKDFPKSAIGKLAEYFGVDKGMLAANL